ncbi:MAG: glycosyl hydrolase family 28 protein [Neorhizobium sp.]|nr:glycosyl hydrolase family 28 protein [Neorhizobium sp.]
MTPKRPFNRTGLLSAGLLCIGLHPAAADAVGDRRHVEEPRLPMVICAELKPLHGIGDAPTDGGDRKRIQEALAACPAGESVRLDGDEDGGRFVSGPLSIPAGVALWIDRMATLAASSDPADYDRGAGTCGTLAARGDGCRPFITLDKADGASIVGDGEIDGQGDRDIKGRNETWWQLARRAQSEGSNQNAPRLIQANGGHDLTLYRITLHNAPNFHIFLNGVEGATIWGIRIDTPATARNTDGIDPASSTDVTIADSFIRTGDDDIAIKAGRGGPTAHVSILRNHLYSGHGMSIGSEIQSGVTDVLVRDMTLDGTTNGLRIKSDRSRGGIVEGVVYDDICMRDTKAPLVFDSGYDPKASGDNLPDYRDVLLRDISGTGGPLIARGIDPAHPVQLRLDNVDIGADARWQLTNATVETGKRGATPSIGNGEAAATERMDCSRRWLPFPIGYPKS